MNEVVSGEREGGQRGRKQAPCRILQAMVKDLDCNLVAKRTLDNFKLESNII